ncbi:MAG: T9SS type A sorting domain-containing protein [Saprospiraceae bacterium]|nr:T9SS type A sorting domain-containing protein [Saprospiraceae bacterium]
MRYSLLLVVLNLLSLRIFSQCTPSAADECQYANVFCSLDELSGYTCSNTTASNPTACLPCNGQGAPHNSSWWAFVTDGGNVTVAITFSDCYNPNGYNPAGVQMGMVSACDCSGQVACEPGCSGNVSTITINGFLQPCKIYYLWVDGCSGDVCNFTITTSGGTQPRLSALGALTSSQTNPICKGCCSDFRVAPQPGGCVPEYIWTLDGSQVGGNTEATNICFPDEGTFSVCVYAVIGNPNSGSICDETPAKCINVVVAKKAEQIAKPRIVCPELSPYKWWCELATTSGTYRCPFKQNGCCEFDSVIDITFLEKNDGPKVFFIGCPGEIYIDSITKVKFPQCNDRTIVKLSKSTKKYLCDSSYTLTTLYPKESGDINLVCRNDSLMLSAQFKNTTEFCSLTPTIVDSMEWYDTLNPNVILGTGNELIIDNPSVYCIRHLASYSLEKTTKECVFTYCIDVNREYFTISKINGNDVSENSKIENYSAKYSAQNNVKYLWKVKGGVILDSFPETLDSISVRWNSLPDTLGEICLSIQTECFTTDEICKPVKLKEKTALENKLLQSMRIIPNPNDGNFILQVEDGFQISGLKLVSIDGKEIDIQYSKGGENQFSIHTKKLESGVYQLKIKSRKKIFYKSIVVQ